MNDYLLCQANSLTSAEKKKLIQTLTETETISEKKKLQSNKKVLADLKKLLTNGKKLQIPICQNRRKLLKTFVGKMNGASRYNRKFA